MPWSCTQSYRGVKVCHLQDKKMELRCSWSAKYEPNSERQYHVFSHMYNIYTSIYKHIHARIHEVKAGELWDRRKGLQGVNREVMEEKKDKIAIFFMWDLDLATYMCSHMWNKSRKETNWRERGTSQRGKDGERQCGTDMRNVDWYKCMKMP